MTTYYYEAHQGDGSVEASSDEEALLKLKEKFGEELLDVMIVTVEESEFHHRTVWME